MFFAVKERYRCRHDCINSGICFGCGGGIWKAALFVGTDVLGGPFFSSPGYRFAPVTVVCREHSLRYTQLCSLALWVTPFEKTILNRFFCTNPSSYARRSHNPEASRSAGLILATKTKRHPMGVFVLVHRTEKDIIHKKYTLWCIPVRQNKY